MPLNLSPPRKVLLFCTETLSLEVRSTGCLKVMTTYKSEFYMMLRCNFISKTIFGKVTQLISMTIYLYTSVVARVVIAQLV